MSFLDDFQLAFAVAIDRDGALGDRLESQPGFAVYRNTTPNALIETLRGHYPVTDQLVGPEAFDALAFDYARRYPPVGPVLVSYGDKFADFLDEQSWIDEVPYLADVARLERLWTETHLADDDDPLRMADLARLGADGWMSLRLPLHPATRFLWARTPAMTIWLAHRVEGGFDRLEPEWRAEGALFTRPETDVRSMPIDAPSHRLLFGLRLGESVRDAAAAVAKLYPETDFPQLFANLVSSGAFAQPPDLERN